MNYRIKRVYSIRHLQRMKLSSFIKAVNGMSHGIHALLSFRYDKDVDHAIEVESPEAKNGGLVSSR